MKQKFTISAAGPMGSGKTIVLNALCELLEAHSVSFQHNRDQHFVSIEMDDADRERVAE